MLVSDPRPSRQPAVRRAVQLKHKYGLTVSEFEEMEDAQGGRCAICGKTPSRLHIDHDHKCCPGEKSCGECIRGLLCGVCNRSLGGFQDDPAIIQSALDYLGGGREC